MLSMRQERIKNGWTLDYVAQKTGVTNQAINLIETGQRKPSYDVLVKLLDLFGCNDPRQLFATVDETQSEPDGNQT